jgi:sortase A
MSKIYYKKSGTFRIRTAIRYSGLVVFLFGIVLLLYFSFPLLSWQIYFAPIVASAEVAAPIPKTRVLSQTTIKSLLASASNTLSGIDYTNATNWFPTYKEVAITPKVTNYSLSFPSINVFNAAVSTVDNDLSKHMVNFPGTAVPPDLGNAVVFGHSTLPQLYNPSDYKTILAKAHMIKVGDTILAKSQGIEYIYKVYQITITDPNDTSVLAQSFDASYLTVITCTPPGTIWKRLIIKSRLEKI